MAEENSNRTRKKPAPRKKSARQQSEENRRDIQALVLVAIGFLLGLGLYTNTTGVVGKGLADFSGYLVGRARYILPLLLIGLGAYLLINRPTGRKKRKKSSFQLTRNDLIASFLLVFAAFSVLDFTGGRPNTSSSVEDLSRAGGKVGVHTGGWLERYTGSVGQFVLTLLMIAVAVVLVTAISPGELVRSLVDRFGALPDPKKSSRSRSRSAGSRPRKSSRGSLRTLVGLDDDGRPVEDDDEEEIDLDAPNFSEDGDDTVVEKYLDLSPRGEIEAVDSDGNESLWEDEVEPVIEVPEVATVDDIQMATPQPPDGEWSLPSMDLLDRTESQDVDRASVEATGRQLEHALAEHGVETRLIGVVVGPTVSRFELELGPGVKVQRVTSLHKDIAYAMATPDVRILAPIPGKQAIGVEVPNVRRQIITVGDLLVSEEAVKAVHPLEVTLGRDITGRTVMANLAKMPHLLVAGQTGSGKSSCINSMLTSILMRSTPDQVRLILIDPKRVELTQYEKLPHLLTEVVTDPKKASNALSWAVGEMERRYDLLSDVGVRDITGYNDAVDEGRFDPLRDSEGNEKERDRLSFIVIVLDELADLMMVAAREVEESICRIAQKARAVGIHLVIATQRPSTNVITGLIKANVPARLAFAVSSLTDSRVILDQPGAERLVGRGDGLINDGTTSTPVRFQGAWVTEEEVAIISDHWKEQAPEVAYDSRVVGEEASGSAVGGLPGGTTGNDDDDELLVQAIELVVRSQLGSTSMLQRKLRVGFARAGRLMDLLEERGVVGPSVGSKPRQVLMSSEDLDAGKWPAAAGAPAQPASAPSAAARTSSPKRSTERSGTERRPSGKVAASQPTVSKPKKRRRTLADIPNPEPVSTERPKRRRPVEEIVDDVENGVEESPRLRAVPEDDDGYKPGLVDPDFEADIEDDFDDVLLGDDEDGEVDPALAPPPGYEPR